LKESKALDLKEPERTSAGAALLFSGDDSRTGRSRQKAPHASVQAVRSLRNRGVSRYVKKKKKSQPTSRQEAWVSEQKGEGDRKQDSENGHIPRGKDEEEGRAKM